MDAFALDDDNSILMNTKMNIVPTSFNIFQEIKKLLRVAETILVLVFLAWASTRAFVVSSVYFRQLANVVVSPGFIFLLSNVIVLTLSIKYRLYHFSHQDFTQHVSEEAHVEEFCHQDSHYVGNADESGPQQDQEEIVYQDKQTIVEQMTVTKLPAVKVDHRMSSLEVLEESEMEMDDVSSVVVDELSNEEFQRAIEAFIARQIEFHREEKLQIMLHHGHA